MSKIENHNSLIIDHLFDAIDPKEMERTKQKMLLAAKIENAMNAKGWKKKDLINAMNIKSPSIVTRWFSGTHNFKIDTLIDLQSVLGINLLNVQQETEKSVYTIHFCVEHKVEKKEQPSIPDNVWSDYSNARSVFSTSINVPLIAEA